MYSVYSKLADRLTQEGVPRIEGVVITGSGMQDAFSAFRFERTIRLGHIKEFPLPTAPGHDPTMRVLQWSRRSIALFSGRCHIYEGGGLSAVNAAIGSSALLGAKFAIFLNASGALNPLIPVGALVLIHDIVDFIQCFERSCAMKKTPRLGRKAKISATWLQSIERRLDDQAIRHSRGVYASVAGPNYETRAEARMLRALGADIVGMSTALEAGYAAGCGMDVAAASIVSNSVAQYKREAAMHEDVIRNTAAAGTQVRAFVQAALEART